MTESIFVRMSSVMGEISAIEKSQRNAHFNFNFRGIDDVMNALHKPLIRHGVFYTPEVLDQEIIRGDKQWHATLRVRYTFYGPAGDSVSAVVTAEGLDSSDKAATKAMSTALKYALLQVFCIPTEEQREMDPDRSGENWSSGEARPSQPPKDIGREVSPEPSKAERSGEPAGPQAATRDGDSSRLSPSAVSSPSSSEGVEATAAEDESRVFGEVHKGDSSTPATEAPSEEPLKTLIVAIADKRVSQGDVLRRAAEITGKSVARKDLGTLPDDVLQGLVNDLGLPQGAML